MATEITARAIADLKAELAAQVERTEDWRARAAQSELEASEQRTRAEAAEQEAAELAGVIRDAAAMVAQAQELLS